MLPTRWEVPVAREMPPLIVTVLYGRALRGAVTPLERVSGVRGTAVTLARRGAVRAAGVRTCAGAMIVGRLTVLLRVARGRVRVGREAPRREDLVGALRDVLEGVALLR